MSARRESHADSKARDEWLGLDAGGSSIKAVVTDGEGAVLRQCSRPTGREIDVHGLASAVESSAAELAYELGVTRTIGLGFAGCITLGGIVRGSPNLPALADVALERALGDAIGARVVADNDAHCHALAESWIGAAASVPTFLLLTLGSGIGSALVLDRRIHRGVTGYGSELGHMVLEKGGRLCACGNRGCVEAYVSEVALRGRAAESSALATAFERLERAAPSGVAAGVAAALFALADEGNGDAERLVDAAVAELGTALGSAVNVYDIEYIVVGGGMAPGFLARSDALLRATGAALFARRASEIRIVAAGAGSLAGAVGAARMAMLAV
jgi:glucokinase